MAVVDTVTGDNDSRTKIGSLDKLGLALFIAITVHAVLILGSSFISPEVKPPMHTLEITLAKHTSDKAPEKADFLAQSNQEGSGTLEEKRILSTTQQSNFEDDRIRNQSALPSNSQPAEEITPEPPIPTTKKEPETGPQKESSKQAQTVVTTKKAKQKKKSEKPKKAPKASSAPKAGQSTSLLARSLEIANLQAEVRLQEEELAAWPRVHRLTSVSTAAYEDAVYLNNWRKRIENVGNLNYPEEARSRGVFGTLRLLVAILPDGSLKSVEILQSSGHKILDDAAIRIVRLASPFQPFTPEMQKRTDILEIIRTWKFEKNAHLY